MRNESFVAFIIQLGGKICFTTGQKPTYNLEQASVFSHPDHAPKHLWVMRASDMQAIPVKMGLPTLSELYVSAKIILMARIDGRLHVLVHSNRLRRQADPNAQYVLLGKPHSDGGDIEKTQFGEYRGDAKEYSGVAVNHMPGHVNNGFVGDICYMVPKSCMISMRMWKDEYEYMCARRPSIMREKTFTDSRGKRAKQNQF